MTDDIDLANENYLFAFERLSALIDNGDVARFGPITATTIGIDIPAFNRIFALDAAPREEIEAAVDWMHERGRPFRLTTTENRRVEVEEIATSLSLVDAGESQPGMVLRSLESIPERTSKVAIEVVTDEDDLAEMVDVFSAAFEVPSDIARTLTPSAALEDDAVTFLIGRVEGQCVSTGTLVTHDDVAGVYSIATVEDHRGQGIGTDLTWEVLRRGRDDGCELGVLQSSEIGYSVYSKMGFETVVEYHMFAPPSE